MRIMTKPSFKEETKLWRSNIDFVIGIDEVGRGAFAGPIVAAGVIFDKKTNIELLWDINDSKLVKPVLRKKCAEIIKQNALYWTVEEGDIGFINKYGIGKANSAVFRKVIKSLIKKFGKNSNYHILIDGYHKKYLPGGIKKQKGIVRGDQKSLSIAAASILAKVYRDDLMKTASREFSVYKFGR
ncbi:MAG: Ribonuclease HII [Candidatus Levybacteria bacterium GW2011_GWA2_36_13]|nr:MAG: Ribonuclease HII [Candidatus Levybacteria bacterium GW2011_GWA2_36_13]